jgi:hypothetical protein
MKKPREAKPTTIASTRTVCPSKGESAHVPVSQSLPWMALRVTSSGPVSEGSVPGPSAVTCERGTLTDVLGMLYTDAS